MQVVVTNQITGTVSHDNNEYDCSEADSDFTVTAALGNTWSHCVNTRLLLTPASKGDKNIVSKRPINVFRCKICMLYIMNCLYSEIVLNNITDIIGSLL